MAISVEVRSTEDLSAAERTSVSELCNRANDTDAFHDLFVVYVPSGGRHFLGFDHDGVLASHAVVTTRWVQPTGHPPQRTAFVDAVATDPERQHAGLSTAVMRRLGREIEDFDLGMPADRSPRLLRARRVGAVARAACWAARWRAGADARPAGRDGAAAALHPATRDRWAAQHRVAATPFLGVSTSHWSPCPSGEVRRDGDVLAKVAGVGALAGWRADPQGPVPRRQLDGDRVRRRCLAVTPVVHRGWAGEPDVGEGEVVGEDPPVGGRC